MFIEDKIYIIEFKVVDELVTVESDSDSDSDRIVVESNSALNQIKAKKYYQKYLSPETKNQQPETRNQKPTNTPITNNQSTIYLIGIEFCKSTKNICSFSWEEV